MSSTPSTQGTPPEPPALPRPDVPDTRRTGRKPRRARWVIIGSTLLIVLAIVVIMVVNNARRPHVDVQQMRTPLVQFVIDTSNQFPDKKWIPNMGATIEQCNKENTRAHYDYMRWAPRGADPAQDAKKIAAYWQSLGYKVSITDENSTYPVVYATGPENSVVTRASFDTSGAGSDSSGLSRYVIGATSKCGDGNAYKIQDEEDKQRCAGKVLYGEEGMIKQPDPMRTYLEDIPTEKQKEYFDMTDPCGY